MNGFLRCTLVACGEILPWTIADVTLSDWKER